MVFILLCPLVAPERMPSQATLANRLCVKKHREGLKEAAILGSGSPVGHTDTGLQPRKHG